MQYSIAIFIGFFATLGLLGYATSRIKAPFSRYGAYCVATAIALFYGLRPLYVGIDTQEYVDRFNNNLVTEDYVFSYIGILISNLGFSAESYLLILSMMTSFMLLFALKNFTGNYGKAGMFLALIAMMPYGSMAFVNIVRQGFAASLILFGLSLVYLGLIRRGYLIAFLAFFVHKVTATVFLLSLLLSWAFRNRNRSVLMPVIIVTLIVLGLFLPSILSVFDSNLGLRYGAYGARDTSESPYLIYAKIAWVWLHVLILKKLTMRKNVKLFAPLYAYLIATAVLATVMITNPLVSSRVLSVADIIIPFAYASYLGIKTKLYIVGIGLLITYAVVSPFIFTLYVDNFGW